MSHLLELLGKGLPNDLGDLLDRYFWSPPAGPPAGLEALCRAHPERGEAHLQWGLSLLREGQTASAIDPLRNACRWKPDLLAARLALAAALDESGQTREALDHLQIAGRIQPGEPPLLFATGFCLEKLRRPQEATEYYRDALARDGELRPARERLAALCVLRGDAAGAIEQYECLRKLAPQEAWIRGTLAHLYHQSRQYARAVEEFETAIAMQPENWSLIHEEVESLVAAGHVRDAIERLHQLIQVQGPFADLHVRLADLYGQVADDEAALRHYHQAAEILPDYLEAAVKLGTHHLVFGRWEQAAEAFAEAAGINDAQMVNYVGLGVAQAAAGKDAEAMNSFELAAAVEPNSTILMAEMARLQLKCAVAQEWARGFSAAAEDREPAVDLDTEDLLRHQLRRYAFLVEQRPDHADLRYHYGILLRADGQSAGAIEQLERAVQLNPSYVQARVKLGILRLESGQEEQAFRSFQAALEVAPATVEAHYWLGLLHTDRRELEEALRHMEAAAEGAPDRPAVRAALAMSLQNLGLMDRCASIWRTVWRSASPQGRK